MTRQPAHRTKHQPHLADVKKFLVALIFGVVVVAICQPVVGFVLEYGITAGVFAAKDKADLAVGAKGIAYVLGGIVFYLKARKDS